MSGDDHPRQRLNNELQKIYGPSTKDRVKWDINSRGPANASTWHARVYINDMEYGYGESNKKSGAQDKAAAKAYDSLMLEKSSSDI
ncbi:hypothetical protein F4604DRAFT_1917702 [Suillus subluteus]|nr:hypothetical protein F4604DRAFT_1917702 [Suillus subluteus]